MSDGTKIEWTDATWNVVNGCSVVSPGCTNCYAMKQAHRFEPRRGLTMHTKGGMVWTGEVRFNEKVLLDPIRWKRPRKIFVCAHGDLFHEKVPDEWIDRVFAVMALASQHTFQVLTKRPERMRDYCDGLTSASGANRLLAEVEKLKPSSLWNGNVFQAGTELAERSCLPNVWLGTSVEDQVRADERIPILLDTPAAKRWISAEPLLGPVDLRHVQAPRYVPEDHEEDWKIDCLTTGSTAERWDADSCVRETQIDWVVAGGESGPGARPMHPDWARSLRDQCAAAGVAFLFKQWGSFAEATTHNVDNGGVSFLEQDGTDSTSWTMDRHSESTACMVRLGKKAAGRELDGVQHDGYPA